MKRDQLDRMLDGLQIRPEDEIEGVIVDLIEPEENDQVEDGTVLHFRGDAAVIGGKYYLKVKEVS